MNITNIADLLINRVKNLKEFKIHSYITEPIQFNGIVPFDISIKNDIATFTVLALSKKEAKQQVDEWLKDRT